MKPVFRYVRDAVYALSGSYGEFFERNHLLVALFELVVTAYAVHHFFRELVEAIEQNQVQFSWRFIRGHWADLGEMQMAIWVDIGETFVFSLMFCLVLTTFVSQFRRSRLGYSFRRMLEPGRVDGEIPRGEMLFDQLLRHAPLQGALGRGHGAGDKDGLVTIQSSHSIVDHIAKESASTFSIRSRHGSDHFWSTWEAFYLNEWLQEYPYSIWQMPAPPATGIKRPDWQGYFSVIVPITPAAWRRIRRGHMSTALAPIYPLAADFVAKSLRGGQGGFEEPLFLLAYTHVYVGQRGDTWNRLKLLQCSVEHVAATLLNFYPAAEARSRCSFSLLCESANKTQNVLFRDLGFEPVTRERDEEGKQSLIQVCSPAGFPLFELRIRDGRPDPHNDLSFPAAEGFLAVLLGLANRIAASEDAVAAVNPPAG